MKKRKICSQILLLMMGATLFTVVTAFAEDGTVRPGTSSTAPAVKPGVRIQAISGQPATPTMPLSQVNVSPIVSKFPGQASDAAVAADLRVAARESGWDIMALLFHVFAESITEMNEDKRYFLQKLADMNKMGEAMGDYLAELVDVSRDLEDSINKGTDVGEDSKEQRSDHAREGNAWARYKQCLDTSPEMRRPPNVDCAVPRTRVRTSNIDAKVALTLQSLDNLDTSLAKVDVSAVRPEGREFILKAREASARFRRILTRYQRLAKQFPYRPLKASDFQKTPAIQPKQPTAPLAPPAREIQRTPAVPPSPTQLSPPITPTLPGTRN